MIILKNLKGNFGVVYKATSKVTGKKIAIK